MTTTEDGNVDVL